MVLCCSFPGAGTYYIVPLGSHKLRLHDVGSTTIKIALSGNAFQMRASRNLLLNGRLLPENQQFSCFVDEPARIVVQEQPTNIAPPAVLAKAVVVEEGGAVQEQGGTSSSSAVDRTRGGASAGTARCVYTNAPKDFVFGKDRRRILMTVFVEPWCFRFGSRAKMKVLPSSCGPSMRFGVETCLP